MPAVVDFATLPQLQFALESRFPEQDQPVLSYKDTETKQWVDLNWNQLGHRIRSMAAFLHNQGVRTGDRVAILSENRPEWTITDMATQLIGAINVSLYNSLPSDQVAYILSDSGSKVLIASTGIQFKKAVDVFERCPALTRVVSMSPVKDLYNKWAVSWQSALDQGAEALPGLQDLIEATAANVRPGDVAALIYTSGTTGTPKGAIITHENFCSNAKAALELVPFSADDHHLSFLPLCHVFERTAGYTAVLAAGGRISYAESINTINRDLAELGPTVLITVPRLFERIYNLIHKAVDEGPAVKKRIFDWSVSTARKVVLEDGGGLTGKFRYAIAHKLVFSKLHERLGGNLRFAVSGGAALPKAIGEFFLAAGVTIIEGYGLTETSPVLTINPFDAPRYGSVGRVIPGVEIGIKDLETGSIIVSVSGDDYPCSVTSGAGEILAKGPNIMKGYWNDVDATAEAIDEAGWFHTGDVGQFEDGRLRITDRIKHMIVSKGGENIYPAPLEEGFKTVAWIDQIVIVGEAREFLCALVVPDADLLEGFARTNNIAYSGLEELYARDPIQQRFTEIFRNYSRSKSAHEKIRSFRLLSEPFSIESGTMTPTLKPRRRLIERKYEELIDGMYDHIV